MVPRTSLLQGSTVLSIFSTPQHTINIDCSFWRENVDHISLLFRDATGTVPKSRKVSGDRGSGGAEPPAGSRGSALVGGEYTLEARAFSQSELPRKPPIDMHGRYTCTGGGGGGGGGGRKKREKKKKSEGLKKSEFRQKSEKRHPCLFQMVSTWQVWFFWFKQEYSCSLFFAFPVFSPPAMMVQY